MNGSTFDPGRRLPSGLVIERLLGSGGMGDVYRAWDDVLARAVAVKVIRPERLGDDEMVQRFQREARAMSRISHPNVVTVYFLAQADDRWYLAMELVQGETLRDALQARGPWDIQEACKLVAQVGSALAEAHHAGICHRDVKPDNILLQRLASGAVTAKVADFGLALMHDVPRLTGNVVLGTAPYLAPEQVQHEQIGPFTDQWALAVLAVELLTGFGPFTRGTVAETFRAIRQDPPTMSAPIPLPAPVEGVLRKALAKGPGARFPSISGFSEALLGAAGLSHAGRGVPCSTCGAERLPSARYCVGCGGVLPLIRCAACGTDAQGATRCDVCGGSLLPPPRTLAGRATPAAVLVAIMDDDDTGEFREQVAAPCEHEGGRVVAFIGRRVIALFGLGGWGEQASEHAVDAGLAVLSEAARSGRTVSVGVECGLLHTAAFGVHHGALELAGALVERAETAAMQRVGLAVGERTRKRIEGRYEMNRVGSVLRRRPVGLPVTGSLPLIGRQPQLAQVLAHGSRVLSDRSLRAAVLEGPPAIGKSRLAAEILVRLDGFRIAAGRCVQSRHVRASDPFGSIVRGLLRVPDGDTTGGVQALEHILGDKEKAAALSRLLGFGERAGDLTPPSETHRLLAIEGFRSVLRHAATQQPTALFIEDAQWLSRSALELLRQVWTLRDSPLFVLLCIRAGRTDAVLAATDPRPSRLVVIELDPLSEAETAQLVAATTGSLPPPNVASFVFGVTRGVPYHVEEFVEALVEADAVRLDEPDWRFDPTVALRWPHVASVVLTRIARTGAGAVEILEAIAAAGGTATPDLLDAMVRPLPATIDALLDAGYLSASGPYSIRQPLVRDIVQSNMAPVTLVRLHAAAARHFGASNEVGHGRALAHHLLAAHDHRGAVRPLLDAARDAIHEFDHRGAHELAQQALRIAREWELQSPDDPQPHQLVLAAAELAATTANSIGEYELAMEAARLICASEESGPARLGAICQLGEALESTMHHEKAIAVFRQVVAEGDADSIVLYARGRIAMTQFKAGAYDDATMEATSAVATSNQYPGGERRDRALGSLHGVLGHIASIRKERQSALEHYAAAREHLQRCSDPAMLVPLRIAFGNVAFEHGSWADAQAEYEAARVLAERYGLRRLEAQACANLGETCIQQRNYAPAVGLLETATGTFRELGVPDDLAHALALLAEARLMGGAMSDARTALQEALFLAEEGVITATTEKCRNLLSRIELQSGPTIATESVDEEKSGEVG